MKKSTSTKIDILTTAFNDSPTIETARELIDTLSGALAVAVNDIAKLEKQAEKMDKFLSQIDCAPKKL